MADHLYALPSGHRLGDYEVQQVLSVGRYGIKYRATDPTHPEQPLAIKEYLPDGLAVRSPDGQVLPTSPGTRAAFATGLARFIDEARGQASVQHPNLIRVHRWFRANGTGYVVLDYAEGQTLSAILDGGKALPEERLRDIIQPLLQPLAQLHDTGFLHHDIKPGTIVLRPDGAPLLLEVGASRQTVAGARQAFGDHSQGTELIAPTAGYSAVEQYSAGNIRLGAWTDLYALGAVMYRCVTGRPPPDAPSRVVQDDLIPAREAAAGRYDEAVLAAIDAALAVKPGERPASVPAWRATFPESWHEGEADDEAASRPGHLARRSTRVAARGFAQAPAQGVAAPSAGGGSARRWLIPVGGALALMALLTWMDVGLLRDGEDAPPAEQRAEAPPTPAPVDDAPLEDDAASAADAPPQDAPPAATEGAPDDIAAAETAEADVDEAAPAEASAAEATSQDADAAPAAATDMATLAAAETAEADVDEAAPAEASAAEATSQDADAAPAAATDMATLIVATDPEGVEVWLDDELVGAAPLELADLAPGVRQLSLRRQGYQRLDLPEQRLAAGEVTRIEQTLAPALGSLAIASEPAGAWIEVDGVRLAETTPATVENLAAGTVAVVVGAEGHRSQSARGDVPPGGTGELSLTLAPSEVLATLTLVLTPPDAAVELLGHDAPYEPGMTLPSGDYEVSVAAAGHRTETRTVAVAGDAAVAIELERTPQPFTLATTPADAQVTLLEDGLAYAPGMELPPGDYRVRVEAAGCRPLEETIAHAETPTRRKVALNCAGVAELQSVLAPSPSAGPTDGDVFARLGRAIVRLQADIDALRLSEASDPEPLPWHIAAAGPSHLYFTAQALFCKDRRAVRAAAAPCPQSPAAVDDIATLNVVVDIVQRANDGLRRMFETEGTAGTAAEAPTATDEPRARLAANLLAGLLVASRQLDTALAIEYEPSDIYDRVEQALQQLGGPTEDPLPATSREEVTSVTDVYRRVFRCLRLSQVLEVKWNLETGKLALSQWQGVDAAPNAPSLQINAAEGADGAAVDRARVYQLATLMVAHLQAAAHARPPSNELGRKRWRTVTSSDVYRLAGALESQLLKMTGVTLPASSPSGTAR